MVVVASSGHVLHHMGLQERMYMHTHARTCISKQVHACTTIAKLNTATRIVIEWGGGGGGGVVELWEPR